MGWQCKVVTVAEPCCTYPKASFLAAIPEDTEVIRFHCGNLAGHMERIAESPATGAIRTFCAKALRRTLQEIRMPEIYVWSLKRLFKTIRKTLQQRSIDAILITAPPFSWMTLTEKIKTVCDVPVILDFRDAWTSNVHLYHGRRGRWSHRAERRTLRAADAAIFNTPGAMEYYVETYSNLNQSHWTVITNGFVKEQIDAIEPERFDRTTLVHGGGARAGMVCMLADAMGKLKAAGKITPASFRFISYGNKPATVTDVANRLDVGEMIEFRGSRSHDEVLASLKGAAGLLLLVDGVHARHVPGKMYEYLGSGKPILMIGPADSDAARILQQTGAGMTVGATVGSIIEGLETVLTGCLSADINPEAIMAYESKALSQKLADLLDTVSTAPPAPF